jgi:hypothetical protein
MKGIKVLQAATLGAFIIFVLAGFAVLIFAPDRMTAFKDLLSALWPLFVAEVIPSFLGTPLKEYVKGKNK